MPNDEVFLSVDPADWIASNDLAFAIRDNFPVTPGHTLVVPKRLIPDWWSASQEERDAMMQLVDVVKVLLDEEFQPGGYNVGFNSGRPAGQTVFHLHVHVIPRHEGDVDDPRGGVRHVIPAKGNYLADKPTDFESSLADAVDSTALITWLLSIIEEGRKTATYKPALLMAIVDAAIESDVQNHSTLDITIDDLAHRMIAQYWPQTRPSPLLQAGVLKQATGTSRISNALAALRRQTRCAPQASIDWVMANNPVEYAAVHAKVARAIALQPIPRLQRPGSKDSREGYKPWLYDDSGFVPEKGAKPGVDHITLKPGVARALAQNAALLRPAIESVWSREVIRYNGLNSEEQELRDFLFGVQRTGLSTARDALLDVEGAHCFWCGEALQSSATQVDHVIPWSHYPLNDLTNLVLADDRCNNDKSARLVSSEHVERWVMRDAAALGEIATESNWPNDTARTKRVAMSAYRWLPYGMPVWQDRSSLRTYTELEQESTLRILRSA